MTSSQPAANATEAIRPIKWLRAALGQRNRSDLWRNPLHLGRTRQSADRNRCQGSNRKLTEARPIGRTIRYQHDANSNLRERLSPNGAKRVYTYDDDNPLSKEEHYLPGSANPSKTTTKRRYGCVWSSK